MQTIRDAARPVGARALGDQLRSTASSSAWYKGAGEVGVYSVAIKIASIITFVMVAFRIAWPAFAYSIEDDSEARRTYAFVLTYLLAAVSWVALRSVRSRRGGRSC